MGTLTASLMVPSKLNNEKQSSIFIYKTRRKSKKNQSIVPVSRLFGPAIFEASKLKVLFLGVDEEKHPGKLPRTYTLTHSDITSKLTLAISQTINNSQVLKAFVHGDENLLKNYPELQEALVWIYFHSNIQEFNKVECWGPLKDATSPSSSSSGVGGVKSTSFTSNTNNKWDLPKPCEEACICCFPPMSVIPWPSSNDGINEENGTIPQGLQEQQS